MLAKGGTQRQMALQGGSDIGWLSRVKVATRARSSSAQLSSEMLRPHQWPVSYVVSWMLSIGLEEYCEVMWDRSVCGSRLLTLEKEDMFLLGIRKLGHVIRLEKAIQELKAREKSFMTHSTQFMASPFLESSLSQNSAPRDISYIKIKCIFEDDISVIRIKPSLFSYILLLKEIKQMYGCTIEIRYKDCDGDNILIKNTNDLKYAYCDWQNSKHSQNMMRLYLRQTKETQKA